MALHCRWCGASLSHVFADLGMSPLSNAFVEESKLLEMEPFLPLRVYVCDACWLVQLPALQSAAAIFTDTYAYFSGFSTSWLEHCKSYAAKMVDRFTLDRESLVMEIASNDGSLLRFFRDAGVKVLGIEPSANVAEAARTIGVDTDVRFFGVDTARDLRAAGRTPNLIAANNVLAHVPDLRDFVGGIPIVLAPRGVVTFEFPHLLRLIEQNQFDTIYQEHYSYLSFGTVKRILEDSELVVFDVEELPTHGGSLRVFARHRANDDLAVTPAVERLLALERAAGLTALDAYENFQRKIDAVKFDLLTFLIDARRSGSTVIAYGAPAKGNTLLNYCGIRTDLVECAVDRNPRKQGRYLPGTRIPVQALDAIERLRPAFILVLPWNLREEISRQLAFTREWGARLVYPIPRLEVVPA